MIFITTKGVYSSRKLENFDYDWQLITLSSAEDINRTWYLLENLWLSMDIWNSIGIPKHMKCQPFW